MTLTVLLSTMSNDLSIIEKMNLKGKVVVINQGTTENAMKQIETEHCTVEWIDCDDRGLSKSRNRAIHRCNTPYAVIADDDLVYVDNYDELILTTFKANPTADMLVFQVTGIEREFKKYSKREQFLNFFTALRVSSVQIALNLDAVKRKNLKFEVSFGAGASYPMGEENIFLADAIRAGLKIKYIPIKIADLHMGESSWFSGYNQEYFEATGAIYLRMCNGSFLLSYLLCLQFALRKRRLYVPNFGFLKCIEYMLSGMKTYQKEVRIKK